MGCITWQRVALRTADFLISAVVVLFLLTAGAYSAYALWDNNQVYAAVMESLVNSDTVVTMSAGNSGHWAEHTADGENGASFEELLAINSDVKAWLTLDNTAIDYPVVQGENNFSYINTDVYGDFALAGSIFLDSDCDGSFNDPYSLLYGHHMENSKMFGDLDLYKDETFFNENTTGTLVLPDRTYHLQIFACLLVPASEDAIFDVNQWDANLNGLLDFAQENALHLHSDTLDTVRAREGAQVLAMSTCSTEFTDARTILLAWMTTPEQ